MSGSTESSKGAKMREHIDKIREAFPRFEWKQYGNFLAVRTEGWILSVDMAFPEHGYSASFTEINYNLLRLPPAASYKACAIAAVKDVLQQTQQNIRFRANQLNKLSEELH